MTEAELQEAVIGLAHLLKWRAVHFRPAMNAAGNWRTPVAADGKGFPDLVLCRDRVMFVELKSMTGRLSVDQQDWLHALAQSGAECHIWRPDDWTQGRIERVLRRRAIGSAA
jgi:VRR-NUC domain